MRKTYIALLGLLIIAASALGYRYVSNLDQTEIRISSNPWVGFTPFIYAQEKGWLKNTPFRFLWLVELSENRRLYENGFVQGFTATQYELLHFPHPDALEAAFLIDRSNGADAILSNRSLAALQAESKPIKVYLERGSLQRDMFHAFINENGLKDHAFELINRSQEMLLLLKPDAEPMLLLSYSPYLTQLQLHGFQTIASSRSLKSFIVVDGLFVNRQVYAEHRADFVKLKEIFDRALAVFHSDPKIFYETVKGYLEGQTFDQFMTSTHDIVWLNQQVDPEMLRHLKRQGVRVDGRIP